MFYTYKLSPSSEWAKPSALAKDPETGRPIISWQWLLQSSTGFMYEAHARKFAKKILGANLEESANDLFDAYAFGLEHFSRPKWAIPGNNSLLVWQFIFSLQEPSGFYNYTDLEEKGIFIPF